MQVQAQCYLKADGERCGKIHSNLHLRSTRTVDFYDKCPNLWGGSCRGSCRREKPRLSIQISCISYWKEFNQPSTKTLATLSQEVDSSVYLTLTLRGISFSDPRMLSSKVDRVVRSSSINLVLCATSCKKKNKQSRKFIIPLSYYTLCDWSIWWTVLYCTALCLGHKSEQKKLGA